MRAPSIRSSALSSSVAAYLSPAWLRGGHLQTIWPAMITPRRGVSYRRERWDTPDGDFIDVDFVVGDAGAGESRPLLVLFHGLEGSSRSHYAAALARAAQAAGYGFAVPHFRGCSGELNRAPRAYHSGDSDEIDWILRRFATRYRAAPLYAAGISLGGNALLKWLGERGEAARFVAAAAAVSPPQDLHAGAIALSRGVNRMYMASFLRSLKPKSLAKLAQYPGLFERERVLRARDFFDFDDAVTAPMHGFASCYDYWERASSRRFLAHIRVPTLVINALNDPFLPRHALASRDEVSDQVTLEYPPEGGHVGFLLGAPPGRLDWLPTRLLAWLSLAARDG